MDLWKTRTQQHKPAQLNSVSLSIAFSQQVSSQGTFQFSHTYILIGPSYQAVH